MAATTVRVCVPPRSGARWLTEVLRAVGVDATHEGAFGDRVGAVDVAWHHCLDGLPPDAGQVRHPAKAIASLIATGGSPQHLAWAGIDYRAPAGAVWVVRACVQAAIRAPRWWQVERAAPDDVAWLAARAGVEVTRRQAECALSIPPANRRTARRLVRRVPPIGDVVALAGY